MSFLDVEIRPEYRSLLNDVVQEFYIPVLNKSVLYRRAVGFFSSSALIELTNGIAGLLKNGGKIELVASPKLSAEDIEAIEDGYERRKEIIEQCLIRELLSPKGKFEEARLNLLSNLIAKGRLELKIAILEKNNSIGMFHEKMGLMYDRNNNIIAFTGSMNESASAFSLNYESIDVYTSWSNDEERALAKQAAFSSIWNDCEPNIRVVNFPNVEKEIIKKYKRTEITDFKEIPDMVQEGMREYKITIPPMNNYPRMPADVEMRSYQIDAINQWEKEGFIGIFDMATGTGKTYTALAAIVRLFSKMANNLAVIIVCPYQHLVEQWKQDIEKFGMRPIVCYSASQQKDWRKRLKTATTSFNLGVKDHFCAVSTNATFSSEYVQNQISNLEGNTLLVVDEAHNFGAEHLSSMLLPNIKFRLALSATIDRYGDEEGTQKLYDYFGRKCIEYTLKEAIDNRMLTPYYYYPVVLTLNDDELKEYLEITRAVASSIAKSKGSKGRVNLSDYAKMLLIKRARLVAAANEKIKMLRDVIMPYADETHILIYCGATTMRDVDYKENQPEIDEIRQIDLVTDLLGNEIGMKVSKFTSEEDARKRETIKKEFSDGKHMQALIAIRCLDEGVNIPSIKTAFILASSTNPKEYIQRRGRVLRTYPGKNFATIYDFITLPIPMEDISQYSGDIVESVKSLAVREITRMRDFASISENPSSVDKLVADIVSAYNINFEERGIGQNA